MPEFIRRSALSLALLACLPALAQDAPPPAAEEEVPAAPVVNSDMDALLFYQTLIGEVELAKGQVGQAYQILLDAARRSRDEDLFKQALGIAMQARAGEEALAAAKAWREAKPGSREAQLTTVQLLAALGRPIGASAAVRDLLTLTAPDQRPGVLVTLPNLFQRAAEPKQVYEEFAPLLEEQAQHPEMRDAAQLTQARLAMMAGEHDKALALTETLAANRPMGDEPMQLALDLMPERPAAEKLIVKRLQEQPTNAPLRLAYGRALMRSQHIVEGTEQFRIVTETQPDNATAWFGLGTAELDLQHPAASEAALRKYLSLLPPIEAKSSNDVNSVATTAHDARQQAWLMLSLAAERQGDLRAAGEWLAKVDTPKEPVALSLRRASLLARQGKVAEGRRMLEALPAESNEQQRSRWLALAQFLREQRDWNGADAMLAKALELQPADPELLYERAMLAERLGQLDQMEAGLRRVIALKPDFYSAYNALGYSLADRNERLPEARELIAKALANVPNEPAFIDSMGWLNFREGRHDEAVKLLRQAYAAFPDAEVGAHLGEALWTSGEQQEALRVWREAHGRDPKNEVLQQTLARLKAKL
ncbi:MAG: tetratricopeptide repeat protein [Paucibacter sp.]|nr:tetratricopeptide repeat protein [Roseateles sp.]